MGAQSTRSTGKGASYTVHGTYVTLHASARLSSTIEARLPKASKILGEKVESSPVIEMETSESGVGVLVLTQNF